MTPPLENDNCDSRHRAEYLHQHEGIGSEQHHAGATINTIPRPSSSSAAPYAAGEEAEIIDKTVFVQLYASHFLSTWNSRLFEFGAVLFVAATYPQTLLPISVYTMARGVAALILAQVVGTWVDSRGRLLIVGVSIVLQRVAILASCVFFWFMNTGTASKMLINGMFAVITLLACVEKVCSMMNLISIERDWVVVITQHNESSRSTLNARMRRIDLFCKLVGPLTISFIAIASTTIAIWAVAAMNGISVAIEFFAVRNVYRKVPALSRGSFERQSQPGETSDQVTHHQSWWRRAICNIVPIRSLSYYFSHQAFIPSFSLSLLYLTVLSFSGQMITYLISVGYSPAYVGIARAVSTVFELSATWIAPRMTKRIGPIRGGIWSLSWQMVWLGGGTIWFFAGLNTYGDSSFAPATGLAIGVAVSRIGLWCYDLCAQSIVQDEIESGFRGSFSTSEAAFQNLFEVLSSVMTIVFSRPDQFKWPVVTSVIAVYVAGMLYSFFVRRRRRHLFHLASCVCHKKLVDSVENTNEMS